MPLSFHFPAGRWVASWPMTALTVAAVSAFLLLGRWQWHRAAEKRAGEVAYATGGATLQELGSRRTAELPRYTQVRAQGRYDGEHQFVLENLSHDGRPGYQVLTPLDLSDGRTLLVNRGWLPLTRSRSELPDVRLQGPSTATPAGRLDALPVPGIALGHQAPAADASWPRLSSFPTMDDLAAALGRPLESRQLLLNADEPDGYVRDWKKGGFGPERHIAYAVQWWGFALVATALYLRLNWQRTGGAAA